MTHRITTVAQADKIDMAWIAKNVDLERAREEFFMPPSNSLKPFSFAMPPLGTWRVDPCGGIDVLVNIPLKDFEPAEGDWDMALNLPSTKKYIEWQKDGYEPPPLEVVRTSVTDGNGGNLKSLNRRRWLAARAAGIESLKCWYSPTHPERYATPKWDIMIISKISPAEVGRGMDSVNSLEI